MPNALEAKSLSYAVPSRPILSGLNFEIPARSFAVVVGENGAGKTTLLQLMLGIIEPSAGSLQVLGKEPYLDPHKDRQSIGYIAEKITPPFDWSISDYLAFNRAFYKSYSLEREAELLKEFRLKGDWKIGTLSAGQVRRAQVVGVLAASPKLLIIDEITAVLDIVGRSKFMSALSRLREQTGTTIIMATNILDDVDTYADQVIILNNGRLMAKDTKENLIRSSGMKNLTDTIAHMIEAAEEVLQ
jgi:ABC-2 type transport system ATP-binding protein